jgi:antirestriction protein ArdC
MKTADLYESVTNAIIKDLEAGVASWVKPWKTNGGGVLPFNAATKRSYNGINIPILWHASSVHGWPTLGFMTYKQAKDIGAQVKGGEKGTTVVFTSKLTIQSEVNEEERQIGYLKAFTVFNVSQIDGLEPEPVKEKLNEQRRDDQATRFIQATGATIKHGGDRAFYRIADDYVQLPEVTAFESYEHYLATALHETVHWSGNKKRLDRDLNNRFGTQAYAAEELVAELGAAFLCAHLGVEGKLRHAEYLANWLQLLKEDNRAIFTAASKASQAADYLRTFSEQVAVPEAA